jgi:hypothetical protein
VVEVSVEIFSQQAYSWEAMKKACLHSPWSAGLFIAFLAAPLSAWCDVDPDAYTQADPDGVPIAVSHLQYQPTPQELAERRLLRKQADADQDWLVRGYEKQLQDRSASEASEQDDSDSPQGSDKNAAGAWNLAQPAGGTGSETGTTLHSADSTPTAGGVPIMGGLLKPLITPLDAPEAAGLHNFYSSIPLSILPPLDAGSATAQAPADKEDSDSTLLDTPGLLAAQDALANPKASTLTLDVSSDPSDPDATPRNVTQLTPSVAMDANLLHKQEALALTPPRATLVALPAVTPPVKPPVAQADDADTPTPVTKLQVISPVHSAIPDPFDILNR